MGMESPETAVRLMTPTVYTTVGVCFEIRFPNIFVVNVPGLLARALLRLLQSLIRSRRPAR